MPLASASSGRGVDITFRGGGNTVQPKAMDHQAIGQMISHSRKGLRLTLMARKKYPIEHRPRHFLSFCPQFHISGIKRHFLRQFHISTVDLLIYQWFGNSLGYGGLKAPLPTPLSGTCTHNYYVCQYKSLCSCLWQITQMTNAVKFRLPPWR